MSIFLLDFFWFNCWVSSNFKYIFWIVDTHTHTHTHTYIYMVWNCLLPFCCLFILLTISFDVQKLLSFMKSNLSIFSCYFWFLAPYKAKIIKVYSCVKFLEENIDSTLSDINHSRILPFTLLFGACFCRSFLFLCFLYREVPSALVVKLAWQWIFFCLSVKLLISWMDMNETVAE